MADFIDTLLARAEAQRQEDIKFFDAMAEKSRAEKLARDEELAKLEEQSKQRKMQAALFHARERRASAQDVISFNTLIATPTNMGTVGATNPLTTPVVIPKNANIGVSFSVILTQGQVTIDTENPGSGTRTITVPALAADVVHNIGPITQLRTLTPTGAIAGTITIYVFDDWHRPTAIATGVFT